MDEFPEDNLNFITCAVWVPHGIAKAHPDKVEIAKEDLARIISETKGEVDDLQDLEAKEGKGKENGEDAAMDVEEAKNEGENSEEKGETSETAKHVSRKDDDELDFETKYGMEDYDDKEDEDEERENKLLQLGKMTIHASSDDDPHISVKDKDDVDSEDENHEILPTDNLIAVGHVEGDAAILEVYGEDFNEFLLTDHDSY